MDFETLVERVKSSTSIREALVYIKDYLAGNSGLFIDWSRVSVVSVMKSLNNRRVVALYLPGLTIWIGEDGWRILES